MLKSKLFLIITLFVFLASCSGKRKLLKPDKIRKNPSPELIINHLLLNQLAPEGLEARANVKYEDEYQSASGTLLLKVRKDSLIWLSIRKFGFEGVRAQITKDSIYILDRLNREYAVWPLSYIKDQYHLPADYKALESVVLGNPFFIGDNRFALDNSDEADFKLFNGGNKGIGTELWVDKNNLWLNQLLYKDQDNTGRALNIKMKEYQPVSENQKFSYFRAINILSNTTGWVIMEIDFSKVEFQKPNRIRFDIPGKYERVQ